MRTLLWKEWREHRPIVLLVFIIPLAAAVLASGLAEPIGCENPRSLFAAVLWSWTLMPLIIGAALVAGERATQTLAFQQALPLPIFRAWLAKLLFGSVVVVVLSVTYTYLLCIAAEGGGYGLAIWLAVPIGWLLFLMAFTFSCCAATPMLALLLSILGAAIFYACALVAAATPQETAWMLMPLGASHLACSYALLRGAVRRAGETSSTGDVRAILPLALSIAVPLLALLAHIVDWLHLDPGDLDEVHSIAVSDDGRTIAAIGSSKLNSTWRDLRDENEWTRPCVVVLRPEDGTSTCFPFPGRSAVSWATGRGLGMEASPWSLRSDYLAYSYHRQNTPSCLTLLDLGRSSHERPAGFEQVCSLDWMDGDHLRFAERRGEDWRLGTYNIVSHKFETMGIEGEELAFLGFEATGPRGFFLSKPDPRPEPPSSRKLYVCDVKSRTTASVELRLLADEHRVSPDGNWLVGISAAKQDDVCYRKYSICDLSNGETHFVWQSAPPDRGWRQGPAWTLFAKSSRWLLIHDWCRAAHGESKRSVRSVVAIEMATRRVCDPFAGRVLDQAALSAAGNRVAALSQQGKHLVVREMSPDNSAGWELDLDGLWASELAWVNEHQLVLAISRPARPRPKMSLWLVDLDPKSVSEIWPRRRALPEPRVVEVDQ